MSENTESGPDLPPLPMTVASPLKVSYQCQTVIGVHPNRKTYYPSNPKPNNYWFLAINRYTLNADYNVVQASNDAVPAGIAPFDNTDYMLVVTTYAVSTNYVPQGPLYAFLYDNGASRQLQRLEQINGALSCGEISTIAYALVGVLGPGPSPVPGIESSSILQAEAAGTILTCSLIATKIDGRIIYSPVMQ